MSRAAAGHNASAAHGRSIDKACPLGEQRLLKTVKAGELKSRDIIQLTENQSGGGTDGGEASACGIMRVHSLDERLAGREIGRAGHTSRENHEVFGSGPGMVSVQIGQESLDTHRHAVGRGDEWVARDRYKSGIQTSSPEDVIGCEGLDIFETVRKENIDTFHILECLLKISNKSVLLYGRKRNRLEILKS